MEFVQWQTGIGRPLKDVTYNALFRLDAIDVELIDKDTLFEIRNEEAKQVAEDGTRVSKPYPNLRVSDKDLYVFKHKCLDTFAKVLGIDLSTLEAY